MPLRSHGAEGETQGSCGEGAAVGDTDTLYPSDNTQELLRHAVEALQRIYRKGYGYRRAGVMLSGMVPMEQTTGRLFDDETLEVHVRDAGRGHAE